MNGSERQGSGPDPRMWMHEFRQYPKTHPLWQDINFTTDWLRERVAAGPLHYVPTQLNADLTPPQQQQQQREIISNAISKVFLTWTEAEDSVLLYAFSPQATQDGIRPRDVAMVMERPLEMLQSRHEELMKSPTDLPRRYTEGKYLCSNTLGLRTLPAPRR